MEEVPPTSITDKVIDTPKAEDAAGHLDEELEWSINNNDGNIIFESINVTSAHRNRGQMTSSRVHVSMFQEHGLTKEAAFAAKTEMKSKQWNMAC